MCYYWEQYDSDDREDRELDSLSDLNPEVSFREGEFNYDNDQVLVFVEGQELFCDNDPQSVADAVAKFMKKAKAKARKKN